MAKFIFTPNQSSEIKSDYDAVIVGAGGAGLTAAIQAHELGLNVAIFEKTMRQVVTLTGRHLG